MPGEPTRSASGVFANSPPMTSSTSGSTVCDTTTNARNGRRRHPQAFAGLGRSLSRLAKPCRAYRQVGAVAAALRTEAATFLAGCR